MRPTFDRKTWLRRGRRIAIPLVVVVAVFALLGFFAAPPLIKSIAEDQIASALGRKATIGAVRFNPFQLAATIEDFRLYQPDGTTVAVQADRLRADVSSASIYRRALVLDGLSVVKPVIRITRLAPDRFDFSDIVDRLAAQPKSDQPFPYSINNIEIVDGTFAIDDRVGGRKHVVDRIEVGLPFISDLPYAAAIYVTPKFAARIDGSVIGLTGKAQPFATTREATLAFDVADLDLPAYLDLAPAKLPFKLLSGKLSAKLALTFRAAETDTAGKTVPQAIALSGQVGLAGLDLADPAGRHALGAESIAVDITKLDPIGGTVALSRVAVQAPDVDVTRRADGSIDLLDLFRMPAANDAPKPAAATPAQPPAPITVAALSVTHGTARFVDRTLAQPVTTTVQDIDVAVGNLALHGTTPTTYKLSMAADEGLRIAAEGSAVVEKKQVTGTVDVKGFRPSRVAPYLSGVLAARIDDGSLDAHARYRLDASGPALAGQVDDASLHVTHLRTSLPDEKAVLLGADAIAVEGASFDLGTRALTADRVGLVAPTVAVKRDAKGRVNLLSAVIEARPVVRSAKTDARPASASASSTSTTPVVASAPAAAGPALEVVPTKASPFTVLVRTLSIERGDVSFEDLSMPTPVRVRAQPLNFKASNVGTAADATVPFEFDTGVDKRGKLAVAGKVALTPLVVDARIDATQVAAGWLAAYGGERLNVVVDSADLDTKGALHVARGKAVDGPLAVAYRGSLRVTRLRTRDRVTSESFVEWKSLDVPTLDFQMPAAKAPLSLALGTVALTDFYARVIVNANGRLNLQDVVATPGAKQSVTRPEADRLPDAPAGTGADQPSSTPQTAAAATGPKPSIRVAGIRLANGRIGITDNFIKPNYSTTLTDVAGTIAAISSDDPQPAALKFAGRIDGEGTLDVSGSVNPLAPTLFVDIAAEAKDIELTRLTAYSVKYAGYAINRGKLSTTVRYHIEDGKLAATNKLFLDQLSFGEHDPNSSANLPVRLAVALLANSKGEINIELPISGSLADPQFSVGGVLWRAFLNLIARAATSPFALIGSAFGGGSDGELGYIQFTPGVSDLTPMGKTKLETLAKALAERPALKLDIIGRYDPATDPEGIKRDHLLDRLKDLKAKDQSKGGERVGRDDVTLSPGEEYDRYLAQLYDATKLADKPRNVIGLAKTLPTAEMEKLLLADIKLDPNDPRWLAEARADVVRHYIEDTGKISAGRVFLVTPKLTASGITDKGVPNRVDFALR